MFKILLIVALLLGFVPLQVPTANANNLEADWCADSTLKLKAEQGDKEAQYYFGSRCASFLGGQDFKQAAFWFTKAANQGHAKSQNRLGFLYEKGRGVTKDYKRAVYWYTKAANQGDADAQFNLGFMYAVGAGVTENYVEAYKWYNISASSASQGDTTAITARDALETKMTPAQIAEGQEKAAAWKPE